LVRLCSVVGLADITSTSKATTPLGVITDGEIYWNDYPDRIGT